MRRRISSVLLIGLLLGCVEPPTTDDDDTVGDSDSVDPTGASTTMPPPAETTDTGGGEDDEGDASESSGGAEPAGCIETRFEALSWENLEPDVPPGTPLPPTSDVPPPPIGLDYDLLPGCTVLSGGTTVVTVSCPVEDSWGNADLNYGCSQFPVAAPGNVLGSHGNEPPDGLEACGSRTIENETVVCYQECGDRLYEFEITSGSC